MPRPGPHVTQEGKRLAIHLTRVARGDGIVDATSPPIVEVDAEHRRSKLHSWVMEEKISVDRFVDELEDLGPNPRNDGDAKEFVLQEYNVETLIGPTLLDRFAGCPRRHAT